jgi:hypothetical protein
MDHLEAKRYLHWQAYATGADKLLSILNLPDRTPEELKKQFLLAYPSIKAMTKVNAHPDSPLKALRRAYTEAADGCMKLVVFNPEMAIEALEELRSSLVAEYDEINRILYETEDNLKRANAYESNA